MAVLIFEPPQLAWERIDATDQSDETLPEYELKSYPASTAFIYKRIAARTNDDADDQRKHPAKKWTRRHDRQLKWW